MTATSIVDALITAGVREYDITETTDGIVEVALSDGGRVSVGEDRDGAWWDFTAYDAHDVDWRTDGSDSLDQVAADIARLAAS